jgi:hypothetical protein
MAQCLTGKKENEKGKTTQAVKNEKPVPTLIKEIPVPTVTKEKEAFGTGYRTPSPKKK